MTKRVFVASKPPNPNPEFVEKRKRGRFFRIVHVRENSQQLALISPPAGICFSKLNRLETKPDEEGSIVIVYCNNITPNDFEKRELEDIDEFIAGNLTVINDKPKGYDYNHARKFETTRNTEYTQKYAFNEKTIELLDAELKAINRAKEEKNLVLKSKPFNSEDVEEKLEDNVLKVVEI